MKRKMTQRRDSQRNKSLPAILMKTIMKRSESSEEEFVGDLRDLQGCSRVTQDVLDMATRGTAVATTASFMPSS